MMRLSSRQFNLKVNITAAVCFMISLSYLENVMQESIQHLSCIFHDEAELSRESDLNVYSAAVRP